MANKTLQLKRQTGFASVSAATTALQSAFTSGTFQPGEPALGILTDGSVVLGIQGDATHGSVFYNAPTIEAAIAQAKSDLLGDAEKYLTLGALEDAIDSMSADTATYALTEVTNDVPATVKKRYQLSKTVGSTTTKAGEFIDIYKDSSIVSIDYINDPSDAHYQNLEYVYIDASGNTQTTYVDMSELVLEAEFASGITITNHVAHGVVDPTSEAFLTVGANGFKLAGVQSAINTAKAAATTEIAEGTDAGNNMSISEATGASGQKVYTINLTDVASATGLTTEISGRRAQTGISGDAYVANSGTIISGATSLNNADVILAQKVAELDAAQISIEKGASSESFLDIKKSGTVYTVTVSGITSAIESAINDLDVADSAVANQFVTSVSEANGKITVSRAQVAASGVTANAISGTNSKFSTTGTTVQAQLGEIVQGLDGALENAYSGVTAGNGITVTPQTNGDTVAVKLTTTGVTGDLLSFNSTTHALEVSDTFDCGTWS